MRAGVRSVCDKFRGMFAFALWDARRHRLLIARDPMGIKPLYYAHSGSHFLFASEVRTLLGTGIVGRRLDPAGLVNFLTFGSAYDPLTLIEGVRAFPAGHALTWEAGRFATGAYWDLVDDAGIESTSTLLSWPTIVFLRINCRRCSKKPCGCNWSATCRLEYFSPAGLIPARW